MKSVYVKNKFGSGSKEEVTVKAIRRDHWQVAHVMSEAVPWGGLVVIGHVK